MPQCAGVIFIVGLLADLMMNAIAVDVRQVIEIGRQQHATALLGQSSRLAVAQRRKPVLPAVPEIPVRVRPIAVRQTQTRVIGIERRRWISRRHGRTAKIGINRFKIVSNVWVVRGIPTQTVVGGAAKARLAIGRHHRRPLLDGQVEAIEQATVIGVAIHPRTVARRPIGIA